MNVRRTAAIVMTCLCLCHGQSRISAQSPDLSKQQKELLTAMIAAVDAAGSADETHDATLRTHVLRASDGSHYVALSAVPPASVGVPATPMPLYVRLATAPPIAPQRQERSLIREWLAGNQAAPPPIARSGIALGEMPIMGPASNVQRNPQVTQGMSELKMLEFEQRRAREREAALQRQRRAELEGRAAAVSEGLPFEDFDFAATASARTLQRALTTGPGNYFLYLAWADPAAARPAESIHVLKKRLILPAATTTELTIGSVILADRLQPRTAAYPPAQQASHPYAFGLTEIIPAPDSTFADSESLSAIFQIINMQASDTGKPNVDVVFQVVRVNGNQEQSVAALTPQNYSEANLPAEFDARIGHPLFASVSAPLSTLKRGDYRLKILVNDKAAGRTATTDVDFTVTATAAALLREAPSLGAPFNRESVLAADVLPGILSSLRPSAPSPALQRAFELAAGGRFVDLMVDEPVPQSEEGVRTALRGLALLAVGDASSAVQFQRAQLLGAPLAPSRFLSGAARAMQLRDPDAIAGWQEALKAGAPRSLVAPYLAEAYLRRNDLQQAAALLGAESSAAAWSRSRAAVLIGSQKEADAIKLIEGRLAVAPDDLDAQWLLLHALFAQVARDAKAAPAVKERFVKEAGAYIDAKGVHAALAGDWVAAVGGRN
jgi:hypothetical protein